LRAAVDLADPLMKSAVSGRMLATELYDRWFAGPVASGGATGPFVGEYRRAHAAVASRTVDGVPVLERYDKLGTDGWWRTWNTSWQPRQAHPRILLSPEVDAAPDLVALLTAQLRDVPYLLACPADAWRLSRSGAVVLYAARLGAVSAQVLRAARPLLRADTPPLCLPVAPGVAVAQYPDNGMTFGEHRCHLLALALRGPGHSLGAIAEVFAAHGVDPSRPYRN
jgi:hypothetical protein